MEALIITLPSLLLLSAPVLVVAFLGHEVVELLTNIQEKRKRK